MDSAQQYIDIFHANRALIDRGSCDALNGRRAAAMADFERLRFPSRRVERYKYIDVATHFAPDYGLNFGRVGMPFDSYSAFRCSVKGIGGSLFYMLGDVFSEASAETGKLPDGVYVGSLSAYLAAHPEFASHYASIASTADDAITALNTALAQDGLLVYIPASCRMSAPIQVVNLASATIPLMCNRRVLVVIEPEADACLLFCEHTLTPAQSFLTTSVVEIEMGRDSHLTMHTVDESAETCSLFENIYVRQEAGSHFEYCEVSLHQGVSRRRIDVALVGEGSRVDCFGATMAAGKQHVDTDLLVDHHVSHCQSRILYKYVLDGEARGVFAGKVLVQKGAVGTESQQDNANLCVSPTAHMYTRPMLEIYADDVKCNHGSTVGRLDETSLFYMAQRGIPPEEARLLMLHAFLDEVLGQISVVPLRERLSAMVDRRLRHGDASCHDCNLCKK